MRKKILFILGLFIGFVVNIGKVEALECVSYSEGDGTESNPYVITTPEELYSISCNLSSYFVLGNDIDLTYDTTNENGLFYNDGRGWDAIGKDGNVAFYFTGTLDGNGYKIKGMHQNIVIESGSSNSYKRYNGLFSFVTGEIKNLIMEDVVITYEESDTSMSGLTTSVGTVVGKLIGGKVSNISVSGSITNNETGNRGSASFGGIVGIAEDAEITDCNNEVNIYAVVDANVVVPRSDEIGGIVGSLSNSTMENCSNKGNITGYSGAGLSYIASDSSIYNCKNYGNIKTIGQAGGLIVTGGGKSSLLSSANYGDINSASTAGGLLDYIVISDSNVDMITIEKCFNAGSITVISGAGGLARSIAGATISNSYNMGNIFIVDSDSDSVGQEIFGGIVGSLYYNDLSELTSNLVNTYNAGMIFNYDSENDKYYLGENKLEYYIGELVAVKDSETTISSSYYLTPFTRNSYGTKLDLSSLLLSTSYSNYDFDSVWKFAVNETYLFPQLLDNTLEGNYVSNIDITNTEDEMLVGETLQFNVDISSDDADDTNIIWFVVNESGNATITQDGLMTANEAGTVKVYAFSNSIGAIYDVREITIVEPVYPLESISFSKAFMKLKIGTSSSLSVIYNPFNTTDSRDVIWTSSDESVLTVDSEGNIETIGVGSAIITATSVFDSRLTASCKIEVVDYLSGDMNDNGKMDFADVMILLRTYLGIVETTEDSLKFGDMNGNGKIDFADVMILLRSYLDIE